MFHLPRSEEMDTLIEDIYSAGRDAVSWQYVMSKIASIFAIDTPMLAIANIRDTPLLRESDLLVNPFGPKTRSFLDHYQKLDILPAKHLASEPGDFITANSLGIGEEYRRTEYYNDFMIPASSTYHTAGLTYLSERRFVAIGLGRVSRGAFTPEELSVLSGLLDHFRRALNVWFRLQEEKSKYHTARLILDNIFCAVATVDKSSRVLWRNLAMENFISKGDVLITNGTISLVRPDETKELQRRIFQCASARFASATLPRFSLAAYRTSGYPLAVEVLPMRLEEELNTRGALIFVTDPTTTSRENSVYLSKAFGLTPVEVKLSLLLRSGHSVSDAAQLMAITTGTARNYVKKIFAKVGVNRQADLIVILRQLSALSSG